MAVLPECRRQGVATSMLAAVEQLAASWGMEVVALHVHKTNVAAFSAYERAGFVIGHTDPGWMHMIPGRIPRYLLIKRIAPTAPPAAAAAARVADDGEEASVLR